MADIYVDENSQGPFNGTSWPTAYQKISEALNEANNLGNSTIHVAPGDYDESNLKVLKENVKIVGRDAALTYDALGLPTGAVPNAARWFQTSAMSSVPLLTVKASGFEVANMVFDGDLPIRSRDLSPALLAVDGFVAGASATLENIWIHGNAFQNWKLGVSLRFANTMVEGNLIARNAVGMQCLAGIDPHPDHRDDWIGVQKVTFRRNRVKNNLNLGVAFAGHPALNSPLSEHGANHVEVTNNDFTGNGNGNEQQGTKYFPQNIQYTALLFLMMHGVSSDQLKSARVKATITYNTFRENGYGVAVTQRLIRGPDPAIPNMYPQGYPFEAKLFGNSYCSNGLNSLFVDFRLIAESRGAVIPPPILRYAKNTDYKIDATGDALTLSDVDLDHPAADPVSQELLNNKFIFNHDPEPVPPDVEYRWNEQALDLPIPIADTTPPRIRSATAVPAILPETGDLVLVSIAIDAGGCDPNPKCAIVGVTSNEPIEGPPSLTRDYEVLSPPLLLYLRAKRTGAASRIYTVTVSCTDNVGKSSTKEVSVVVPSHLRRMWLGMLTRNAGSAGPNGPDTDDPIVLIVNERGKEKVHETFLPTPQGDQDRGQASLYALDVSASDIVPENLSDSSIRVAIRGADTWEPEHLVVWGERDDGTVVPLAIERDMRARSSPSPLVLTTKESKGDESFPLRLVSGDSPIDGILVLMTTANVQDAQTDDFAVGLEITQNGTSVVNHIFNAPPQKNQRRGQANLYFIPVTPPFNAILLRMHSGNPWLPASFFLFGTRSDERQLVPMVHKPDWGPVWMSANPGSGQVDSVLLWQS